MPPTGLKLDAFVRISLHAACKKVRQAPDGTRNTTLNTQAYYAFLDLVPQGADEDIIAEELRDAAHETGLDEDETERTIESARSDAAAKRERGPQ